MFSGFAFAMPSKCELQAHSNFQRQSVEVELASIVGTVSSIELASRRETLQRYLVRDQAHCIRLLRQNRKARTDANGAQEAVSL